MTNPLDKTGEGRDRPDASTLLARQERCAALRAMAGRLAHEMRNPLAAVRAACGSLREEIADDDHKYRLELTLQEVDRVLGLITDMVQAARCEAETPTNLHPAAEINQAATLVQMLHPAASLSLPPLTDAVEPCRLPRNGLRVAVYSLLDYLFGSLPGVQVSITLTQQPDLLHVHFAVTGMDAAPALSSNPAAVGLLVAERYARDTGGRLQQDIHEENLHLTLELLCRHE